MSNWEAKKRRRQIVEALRAEGAADFVAGKDYQHTRYNYADLYQWQQGWLTARDEARRNEERSATHV